MRVRLVAPTRLPDTSAIREIAYPDRLDPSDPMSTFLPSHLAARVNQARTDRLQRQIDAATLPRVQRARLLLSEARSGDNELARLAELLPSSPISTINPLIQQAEVTLACFAAGVSMSAGLSIGGFDTHGNHDASHTPRIQQIVQGVTWIMDEAERLGIADQLVVVVGSDFARTPWYNDNAGKDHWSITSMMMMGPGIRGKRVVGATDATQIPMRLDPDTLKPDEDGIRLTPADVHASLRALAGIDDHPTVTGWSEITSAPTPGTLTVSNDRAETVTEMASSLPRPRTTAAAGSAPLFRIATRCVRSPPTPFSGTIHRTAGRGEIGGTSG